MLCPVGILFFTFCSAFFYGITFYLKRELFATSRMEVNHDRERGERWLGNGGAWGKGVEDKAQFRTFNSGFKCVLSATLFRTVRDLRYSIQA